VLGDRRRRDPPGPAAQAALARMVFGRAASDAPETLVAALSATMESDAHAVRTAFLAHICGD